MTDMHVGMYQRNFNIAGGMPKQILKVAERFDAVGVKTTILTDKYQYLGENRLIFDLVEIDRNINSFKRVIKERDIDLINIHSGYSGVLYSIKISSQLNIPIIPTIHTQRIEFKHYLQMGLKDILNSPERELGPGSLLSTLLNTRIISKLIDGSNVPTFSGNSKRIINTLITNKKSWWIPPGVDINLFKPQKKRQNGDKFVILFFGRALMNRGIDTLIRAFEYISKLSKKFTLEIILLPDRNSMKIKRLAYLSPLHDRINVVNKFVNNIPEIINNSDIVVFPIRSVTSIPEYPLTILEAMACEKPIIASSVGAIPEIISNHNNGILLSTNSAQRLSQKIIYLFKNPDKMQDIGKRARKYVLKNHDWKNISQKTMDMYLYGVNIFEKR